MGTFAEHIKQSKRNIKFLSNINTSIDDSWDWQVTVCFYSALHLMNAHIVSKTNKNYLSHSQVSKVINPYNQLSVARLDENIFLSYNKLFQLSRRSRYLLKENFEKGNDLQSACVTYSKHLKKSIHHLDVILTFISKEYNVPFNSINIKCVDLKTSEYSLFNKI